MKIVNIFINCIILKDVQENSNFYINGEKVRFNVTLEKINNLFDGFLPISFNVIEDCLLNNINIEVVCTVNKIKSKPIFLTKDKIISFIEKTDKKFIPKIITNLLKKEENVINSLDNKHSKNIDNLNQYASFRKDEFKKTNLTYRKKILEFTSNYSFLNSFKLDNPNDEKYFFHSSKLFNFNLNFFFKFNENNLSYWFNFKIIYYALRILEKANIISKKQMQENVEKIFDETEKIIDKYNDFILTTYFQKSFILILKLSLSKIFINNVIFKMYEKGLSLIIKKEFIETELDDETAFKIKSLFYWFEEEDNLVNILKSKFKKDNYQKYYLHKYNYI